MLVKIILLALLAVLACIEKLGSIMNTLAIERDWVSSPHLEVRQEADYCFSGCCDRGTREK